MKIKVTPSPMFIYSLPVVRRLVGGFLAISALLLPLQIAHAQWASQGLISDPIYNDFEDGEVPFGDGFPSSIGGTIGWNSAWTVGFSAGAVVKTNVLSDSPLNGTSQYLRIGVSNTTSAVAARRQYTSYFASGGPGSSTNLNTFDVAYIPHRIKFDIRGDSFAGKVFTNLTTCVTNYVTCTNGTLCTTSSVYADPPLNYTVTTNAVCTNTPVLAYTTNNWSSANDNIFAQASSGAGTTPGNASAWVLYVQGAASAVNIPFGPANKWLLYDGNPASPAQGSGNYIDSGMTFSFGAVYHVEIINDPRDKSYTVQISNGGTTNKVGPLRWRACGDLTQVTARSFVHYGGQCNDTNSALNLSVDSIVIEQLPPGDFPPLVSEIRPTATQPFTQKISAAIAGAGVPPLNFTPDYDTPEFWPASRGISFIAQTGGGGSNDYSSGTWTLPGGLMATARAIVPTTGIGLVLNGVDVSGSLSISTPYGANLRKVKYNGLVPNTFYTGMISVTNSLGVVKQCKLQFNTLDEDFVKIIEAEDYNYSDGSFTRAGVGSAPTVGGMFLDNPVPSDFTNNAYINQSTGYVDRMGHTTNSTGTIDYFVPNNNFGAGGPTNFNVANNLYRIADAVATSVALDFRRTKYNTSGARDFQVFNIRPGQWMNYTRTFAAGTYSFYLRGSSTQAGNAGTNAVNLDYVTSDPTQPGQTTTNIGIFRVAYTGNAQVFTNAPLIDTNTGSILTVTLPAGVHTLRLTALNAGNNLQLNYLIAAPAPVNAPTVAITSPADGATFSSGANVTLQATATAGSTVTYYNGTTSFRSSARQSHYTVNLAGVPTGKYSITAKATAGGFTAKSAPVNITVGSPARKVLFVIGGKAGDPGAVDAGRKPGGGDNMKRSLFSSLGWTTTDMYATNLNFISGQAAAGAGFDMVAVSVGAIQRHQHVFAGYLGSALE